ncbi:hypothetical protein BAT02nite_20990 [Bacillus atrophaeus]|jgi:hypothetical protein|nr:hypothetical protein BAT02nite_20990 [Bacillus atrophaeus]
MLKTQLKNLLLIEYGVYIQVLTGTEELYSDYSKTKKNSLIPKRDERLSFSRGTTLVSAADAALT